MINYVKIEIFKLLANPGVGKHFLQRATFKMLLLPGAANINCILPGAHILHNSHFRLSKNTVSNETHGRKSREF